MTVEMIAAIAAAFSAAAAMVTAWLMYRQTQLSIAADRAEALEREKLQERENALLMVQNKILVSQMWNEINKIVIEGDGDLRDSIAKMGYNDLDTGMIRRVYMAFSTINVIEVAWLLNNAGMMPSSDAQQMLNDLASVLSRDKEAVERALNGRGYSEAFLRALWPKIFPDKPMPLCVHGEPKQGDASKDSA